MNTELDVVVYGNTGNKYPYGPGTGWLTSTNVSVSGISIGQSIYRKNTSTLELIDTNTSSDWDIDFITNGSIPNYANPPELGELLISEVMYGGTDNEWIELVNNGSSIINIGGSTLHSYRNGNITVLPNDIYLLPYETYVIGEDTPNMDYTVGLSLNDAGDLLVLKNPSGENLDVVSWGTGTNNFTLGISNGWSNSVNVTGGLSEGESIFRYNLTKIELSDTNQSTDWYTTTNPTINSFYVVSTGDILITEISMGEALEFIEFYSNKSFPITMDGMYLRDFGLPDDEIIFSGNVVIFPNNTLTAGDVGGGYDYPVDVTFTNTYEDLVLYTDTTMNTELDVVVYGNTGNKYPWGPGTGWFTSVNVSLIGLGAGDSIHRVNGSDFKLVDTNTSADWVVDVISAGVIRDYVPPPPHGNVSSILITEVMIDPEGDEGLFEYIEIYNTQNTSIDLSNWTIWHSDDWGSSADATLPANTILPAYSYLVFVDNIINCSEKYGFTGYNHSEALTMSNSVPKDIILADPYRTIIDRVAYRMSSENYVNTLDNVSWAAGDPGVYDGSEGRALARLYDPYNNDEYLDTNTTNDWRYNVHPSVGKHTNNTYFLSTPMTGNATVIAFSSPDNSYAAVTDLFNIAQTNIDLTVYQFTSSYLLDYLITAMNRGVKVRVILEDSYPGASVHTTDDPTAHEVVYVAKTIDAHENGSVRWERYAASGKYTHAKYFIIDNNTVAIMTENFKSTGIPKDPSYGNRGWGIAVNNTDVAAKYLNVFELDWSLGEQYDDGDVVAPSQNLDVPTGDYVPISTYQTYDVVNVKFQTVVGPDETIDVIVDLINSATTSIYIENFYLYPTWTGYPGGENNNPFLQALISAAQKGLDIKVILDSTYYNIDGDNNNDEAAQILDSHGIDVKFSNNSGGIEKFHVKAMIVDAEVVMISSLNWNENSATNNREIGIIINSSVVAAYYVDLFNYDWEFYSTEEIIDYNQPLVINTYTWLVWLPIISIIYMIILASGYSIRHSKEKTMVKKQFAQDKAAKKREQLTGIGLEPAPQIPVDITAARENISYFYGDTVKVSHLNAEGTPVDNIIPSYFVMNYIQYNHEMLDVGVAIRPIPQVLILKFNPDNYIAIEGTIELNIRLMDEALKVRISQMQTRLNSKDLELSGFKNKIRTLEDKVSILESTTPLIDAKRTKTGKSVKVSNELKQKEKMIQGLKKKMKLLEEDRADLERDLSLLTGGEMMPLSDLINELQVKIRKQDILIKKLEEGI